jgi:3-oxoacyl-[acyl-carrier protein] reductase
MQIRFDDRVVIVTGAAQGIGRAIAESFIASGASVHLADRDADGIARAAAELGAVAGHAVDLSDRPSAHSLVADVERAHGRLDIVATAAGGVCGQVGRPIEEIDESDWRALFAANLDSAFWLAQAAAPLMKKTGGGRIITIASGAGLRPSLTGIQGYTAAKHALVGLTRQLSWELGPHGITVNSVAPGFVLSNPTTPRQWEALGVAGQERLTDSIHTKRLGTPQDIATAVAFFASEQAAWISGQVLSVDGGRS